MIYVTGDTHGNFRRFQPEYFPEQAGVTKNDVVIIAGDFGGVWFGDSRDDETLDWLERLPFTLAFVCGNHENYDALERYPVAEWHGSKVHRSAQADLRSLGACRRRNHSCTSLSC